MTPYTVTWDGGRVVLPPAGDQTGTGVDFSTFGTETRKVLEKFCRDALPERRLAEDESVRVSVALIHRPDNSYNPRAISVAMPASFGGDVRSRHLGYLYDPFLREVGTGNLPALAALSGGEIECTALLFEGGYLTLDLPDAPPLRRAVEAFLADPPAQCNPSPRSVVAPPPASTAGRQRDRRHTDHAQETVEALEQLRTFAAPLRPVEELEIAAVREGRGRPRSLRLTDRVSGRAVGTVAMGYLFLEDERDRDDVLFLLEDAGVPVAQPRTLPALDDPQWPADAVPNMWTYWFAEGLDLRPRDPRNARSWTSVAHFNPTTRILWVEDSRLVAPSRLYAARVGLPVSEVGLPRTPWALEIDIPYDELKDHSLRPPNRHQVGFEVRLLDRVRALVPDGVLADDVTWLSRPARPDHDEPDAVRILHERHVRQRHTLFGEHDLGSTLTRCRLCGQRGLRFTAPLCTEPLTYCHGCLDDASRGRGQDRSRAAQALRLLGKHEFGDSPMLETQLDTLHVNPAEPVAGTDVDRLLLLRFAIARRQYAWTHLLVEAGFAEDGLRGSRGTLIRARDGHLCHSLMERAVCDFLHQHDVPHDREPLYPLDAEHNPTGLRRADWLLADGTFVELWGMPNDPVYAAKMQHKRELAVRHGLRLVEVIEADLPRLPEIFAPWLPAGTGPTTTWTWSPLAVRQAPAPTQPKGDDRGRNDFNSATRRERLDRSRRAVRLQEAGLSRKQIGVELGVSQELVKSLLRDGKFYADPSTDPDRLELAGEAANARAHRLTRAQFQAERALSAPKAQEAWRDADVLHGAQAFDG